MWMILGRIILGFMTGNRQNIMMGVFSKVTEPVFRVTRRILPFANDKWIPVFAMLLIIIVRIAMVLIFQPGTNR